MAENPALSQVTDTDTAPDEGKAPWSLVLTGWAITAGLAIVQVALLAGLDRLSQSRFEAVIAREKPLLFWREDVMAEMPAVLLLLCGLAVIPWAFGGSLRGRHKPLSPRWRRVVIVGALVLTAASAGVQLLYGGQSVGLAFADGAAWADHGRIVERRPWSQATSVFADCDMVRRGRYGGAEPRPAFTYEVAFPGRSALLSYGVAPSARWMEKVAPIDARLRAAGVRREGVLNATCLHERARPYGVGYTELKALLTP